MRTNEIGFKTIVIPHFQIHILLPTIDTLRSVRSSSSFLIFLSKLPTMKKSLTSLFLISIIVVNSRGQSVLYVSASGNDQWIGSNSLPLKTLEGAYDKLPATITTPWTIILKGGDGPIQVAKDNNPGFIWLEKSGTELNPINITSESCFAVLTRPLDVEQSPMIRLRDTNYITFSNIHFYKGITASVYFDNTDHSAIRSCKFSGDGLADSIGSTIIIGGNPYATESLKSTYNIIANNIFFDQNITGPKHQHQAIYLQGWSEYNTIFNNTVFDPPAYGIHFWHDNYRDNRAIYNILTQNISVGGGDRALAIGTWAPGENCVFIDTCGNPGTVINNSLSANYVYDALHTEAVYLGLELPISNYPSDSSEQNANFLYANKFPSDPYWLSYNVDRVKDRVIVGDFNRDGYEDDIAALYDNGNGTTNIHVWNTDPVSKTAFDYSGSNGWWYGSAYTAGQTTGRVISGDFDNDSVRDDIAAFYDYGNSLTQIHVWTSDGSKFTSVGAWWSNTGYYSGGYDANRITDRVVSGDFDGDGFFDDIAAFYDNGNSTTNLHLWSSNGSSFQYFWGAGWWGDNISYDVTKITGRVVAVDFNRDTLVNEIAAFYDLGNGNTRLDVWTLFPNTATYSPGKWTKVDGTFNANNLTGRVIAGKFNHDIYHDDIAGFYRNGAGQTVLDTWSSSGSIFSHNGSWWNSSEIGTGYEANNISFCVVSGDFNRDGKGNDITVFYDYKSNCGSLRTNVWRSTDTAFSSTNYTLGYPWLTPSPYIPTSSLTSGRIKSRSETHVITKAETEHLKENILNAYPNPTSKNVVIELHDTEGDEAELSIYSNLGKLVKFDSLSNSGTYLWDGTDNEGIKVKPGIYLIVVRKGRVNISTRIVME
jgi:hypothetical protein